MCSIFDLFCQLLLCMCNYNVIDIYIIFFKDLLSKFVDMFDIFPAKSLFLLFHYVPLHQLCSPIVSKHFTQPLIYKLYIIDDNNNIFYVYLFYFPYSCDQNWFGPNCTEFVCINNNPCLNGATCSRGEGNDFICDCAEGFSGTLCDGNDGKKRERERKRRRRRERGG